MDRAVPASSPSGRVSLRPDRLARVFFGLCVIAALWLSVPPVRDYFAAQDRAASTGYQLQSLQDEQRRLAAQSHDLSKGTGLEEQARRQGLIDPSERSYVIEDLPQP